MAGFAVNVGINLATWYVPSVRLDEANMPIKVFYLKFYYSDDLLRCNSLCCLWCEMRMEKVLRLTWSADELEIMNKIVLEWHYYAQVSRTLQFSFSKCACYTELSSVYMWRSLFECVCLLTQCKQACNCCETVTAVW